MGLEAYLSLSRRGKGVGWEWGWVEWALITFSAFRVGALLRWALIRINTVV